MRHWRHGGSGIERGRLLPGFKSRQSGSRSKLATAKEIVSPHIPLDFPWRAFHPPLPRFIDPDNLRSIRVAEKCGYREFARSTYKGRPTILFER